MDLGQARTALTAQRDELQQLLSGETSAQGDDRSAEADADETADTAQPLEAQGVDDAVAAGLREKLAAVERALQRVDDGTYGRSVRSGAVIPDARLEADPAAELTVEEASAQEQAI